MPLRAIRKRLVPGGHCRKTVGTSTSRRWSSNNAFKILFFGRDEFSCVVLDHLYNAQDTWSTIDVVTNPDIRIGRRGSKLSVSPLKLLSERLGIPVHTIPPDKPSFKHWQLPQPFYHPPSSPIPPPSNRLLITASFGRILPSTHISSFLPSRKLNVHPSLLPLYRGASPIQHAILDGRKETGVCVIEMVERKVGVDGGEIWGMTKLPMPGDADFPALRDTLAHAGGRLLVQVLQQLLAGTAASKPQPYSPHVPRAPLLGPADSVVDFGKMSAEDIVRRYRAIAHQRPLHAYLLSGKTIQFHNISLLSSSALLSATIPSPEAKIHLPELTTPGVATYDHRLKALVARCADGSLVKVGKVKQQDRTLITAKEWWNGVRPEDRASSLSSNSLSTPGPVKFVAQAV